MRHSLGVLLVVFVMLVCMGQGCPGGPSVAPPDSETDTPLPSSNGGNPPSNPNPPPATPPEGSTTALTANAGPDQTVEGGTIVALSCTANGGAGDYHYAWSLLTGPRTPDITNAASPIASVTLNVAGTYRFRATVTDAAGQAASAELSITVSVTPLTVEAVAAPSSLAVGGTVSLTAKTNGGAEPASFRWEQSAGSPLTIGDATSRTARATPPAAGSYRFKVTVTDASEQTATADVGVSAVSVSPMPVVESPGRCKTSGLAFAVAIAGNRAYMATTAGLEVIDVSSAASPTALGKCQTDQAYGITVSGNYAYLSTSLMSGPKVIDISNPASPKLVGEYPGDGPWAVAVAGSYAYVAFAQAGVQVLDISNPASPTHLSDYKSDSYVYGVAVTGKYAYVADQNAGLQVVDVSNPASPTRVGGCALPEGAKAKGITVSGSYAYVACQDKGLQVVNVSDPTKPVRVGGCVTTDAVGVAVAGRHACVADGAGGLRLIDVSDPASPVSVDGNGGSRSAKGVAASGDHAYVADGINGLIIVRIGS